MFSAQIANEKTNWEEILAVLAAMEKGRWSGVYTYDHFIPPLSSTPDVKDFELDDTLEGWSLLASIAAVTKKLNLGVLVTGITYRNPALLAKMAATIDVVSKGRMILGIGAGWNIREHEAYGWDFPPIKERSDRLEEAAELIKKLFNSDGRVSYQGQYYQLKEASFCPRQGGSSPIPIMIGGKGKKRTLKTLAKYGDIMNVQAGPAEIRTVQ
jgi:alkanesulfonate monooxygenase SsuD/methylene tetrahydromethanopterin reductase-like flavin-dependent oxidoreductase (luciferase family)